MGLNQSFTIFKEYETYRDPVGLDIFVFRNNSALSKIMAGFTGADEKCVWTCDITKDDINIIKQILKIDRDDFGCGEKFMSSYDLNEYFEIMEAFKRVGIALRMGLNVEYVNCWRGLCLC
jgi:hypothetical protein